MAKRAPQDEQPYRPLLDPSVVSAALTKPTASTEAVAPEPVALQHKIVEFAPREADKPMDPPHGSRPLFQPIDEPARPRAVLQTYAEKLDQEKRILFTRQESRALDRLVTALATRLNAQVKVSHVMRALALLILNAEGEVDKRAGETGPLVRPPNGDVRALQRFEREIARIIGAALRDAGPLK